MIYKLFLVLILASKRVLLFNFVADIDECTTGLAKCHQQASCINYDGSYVCECNSGYVGDGKTSCLRLLEGKEFLSWKREIVDYCLWALR